MIPTLLIGQDNNGGNPFDKFEKYDERGNLIQTVGLTPEGEIAETYFSEYDTLNRLTKTYKIEEGRTENDE